jgi:hypothetical protein
MPPRRVSEASPVQVYLGPDEQQRLTALAERLKTNKSDVLRRGLLALERELGEPDEDPMLRAIGVIKASRPDPLAGSGLDPARDHDAYIALAEERRWAESQKVPLPKPARRRRGR